MYGDRTYLTSSISASSGNSLASLTGQQEAMREAQVTSELQHLEKLIEEHAVMCANLQQRLQPVMCIGLEPGQAIQERGPEPQRAPIAEALNRCNRQLSEILSTYRGVLSALEI